MNNAPINCLKDLNCSTKILNSFALQISRGDNLSNVSKSSWFLSEAGFKTTIGKWKLLHIRKLFFGKNNPSFFGCNQDPNLYKSKFKSPKRETKPDLAAQQIANIFATTTLEFLKSTYTISWNFLHTENFSLKESVYMIFIYFIQQYELSYKSIWVKDEKYKSSIMM